MRYVRKLAFAILSAALVAFAVAGNASATELDNGTGMVVTGSTIAGEADSPSVLHSILGDIICSKSLFSGKTTSTASLTETLKGNVEKLTFESCNANVSVLKPGILEMHTQSGSPNNNGTLTSSGAEVTVILLGFHCIFSTSNTDIGTLTGSASTGSTSTVDISATIPRTGGSVFCGSTAQWTGSYKIIAPDSLNVT